MSAQNSQIMATVDNFNMADIDLEQNEENKEEIKDDQQQSEILNIGEFVFNHITAESGGSCTKSIRRKIAIYSKCLIKSGTIADVILYIMFLFVSLFLLVQKNTLIGLKLNWLLYVSLVTTFVNGIIGIWLLKLVIEAGYEHKTYLTYLLCRLLSIFFIMMMILYESYDHLTSPPLNISSSKKNILVNFGLVTITGGCLTILYISCSSIVYFFHLSIVKEFYKIVSMILESQDMCSKRKRELDIGISIPEGTVGMPYYEDPKMINEMSDESYAISMKKAKFEVEIELEDETNKDSSIGKDPMYSSGKDIHKIKIFECPSESSEGNDSYRINPLPTKGSKKFSEKIVRGRRMTLDNDNLLSRNRNISENVYTRGKVRPDIIDEQDQIDEESSDKYGLDYLEDYQNKQKGSIAEGPTAFTTTDYDMIASPVSKLSMQKKISVKNVTRKKSFSSGKMVRVRSFTMAEIGEN